MVRKWDRLLLDACERLGLLPPRVVKMIEFSDSPEELLAAQLDEEKLARLRREAAANLPLEVANALQQPSRSIGRFVLVEETGTEGRGIHYRGWDKATGNPVEVVNVPSSADVEFDRLFREASAAANLNHPIFARVLGAEKHPDGVAIGFERVPGDPVAPGRTALGFLLPFAREAAYALHEAHERGVLHLDLKPSNVLISGIWSPKIRGAGLSRALSPGGSAFGRKGLVGTPGYMAPEQVRGREESLGPRTDVYGFGATMYHWLTGQPPLPEEDPVEVFKSGREAVRLRNVSPQIPKELESIVMKCLLPDPKERYANCREVGEELQRHLASKPVAADTVTMRIRVQRFAQQRKLALVLFLIFVSLATYAVTYYTRLFRQARQEQFQDLVLRIRGEYYSAGAFANARELVEEAVRREPGDPIARYWKLRLAVREELGVRNLPRPVDFEGALEWIPPPKSAAPARLAQELAALEGEVAEDERAALEGLKAMLVQEAPPPDLLERSVTAGPWDGEAKLYLGLARLRAGEFAQARTTLEPLLKGPFQGAARSAVAMSFLGAAIAGGEGGASADSLLDRGLQIEREHGDPRGAAVAVALLVAKARLAAARGAVGQAFSLLRRAIEAVEEAPADLALRLLRAEVVTSTAAVQASQGRVDDALRELAGALREFEAAGAAYPREPAALLPWTDALSLRALLHERRRDAPQAVSDLSEAIAKLGLLSGRPDAALNLQWLLRRRAALQGAGEKGLREEIAALDEFLASKPEYAPALLRRGRALAALAQLLGSPAGPESAQAAVSDLVRAVEISQGFPDAVLALAEARVTLADLLEPTARDGAALLVLEALDGLNRLLKGQPRLVAALRLRADTLARLALGRAAAGHDPAGIATLVERDFERILEADPKQPDAQIRRANALYRIASAAAVKGYDPAPAIEKIARDCSQVLRRDSRNVDVLALRGRAYLLQSVGDLKSASVRIALQQAAEDFSQALNARPGSAWLYRLRGESRLLLGLHQRANLEDPKPLFLLAESDLKQALNLDPSLRDQIEPLLQRMR